MALPYSSLPNIVVPFSYNRFCSNKSRLYSLCCAICEFITAARASLWRSAAWRAIEKIDDMPDTTLVMPPSISPVIICPAPAAAVPIPARVSVRMPIFSPMLLSPKMLLRSSPNCFTCGAIVFTALPMFIIPAPILSLPPDFIWSIASLISLANCLNGLLEPISPLSRLIASCIFLITSGDPFSDFNCSSVKPNGISAPSLPFK